MPLFAAWRAMPVPDDASGRGRRSCCSCCASTRGAYVVAVRAGGLHPAGGDHRRSGGRGRAVAFGWQPPYPPAGPLVRRRLWAEAVTDRLAATRTGRSAREGAELLDLLTALRLQLRGPAC